MVMMMYVDGYASGDCYVDCDGDGYGSGYDDVMARAISMAMLLLCCHVGYGDAMLMTML